MVLFPAKRTFKISQLQSYMSHVNETWPRYVPPQQLSFAGKWGWQWMGGWVGCIQKTIKKCHEINIIFTLTRPNNGLKNAMKVGFVLLSSLTIWLDCWEGTHGKRGGSGGWTPHMWGASYSVEHMQMPKIVKFSCSACMNKGSEWLQAHHVQLIFELIYWKHLTDLALTY